MQLRHKYTIGGALLGAVIGAFVGLLVFAGFGFACFDCSPPPGYFAQATLWGCFVGIIIACLITWMFYRMGKRGEAIKIEAARADKQ